MSNIKKILSLFSLLLFIIGFAFNPCRTLGITLGTVWGFLNIFFLKQVLQNLLLQTENKNRKLLMFSLIKFPLLYLLGFALLSIKSLSALDLLIGFTLALVGTLLKFTLKLEHKGVIR